MCWLVGEALSRYADDSDWLRGLPSLTLAVRTLADALRSPGARAVIVTPTADPDGEVAA